MKTSDQETIDGLANRDDRAVIRITMGFAVVGALFDIGAHTISAFFLKGGGLSMLWGIWIPLCFITIPPIHYLCRHVRKLQERIDAIEMQVARQKES